MTPTSDMDKRIEEAAKKFMEDEVQMTDHFDDYKECFTKGARWALEYADTIKKHEFRYVEDIQIRANGTSNTVDVELTLES